MSLLPRRFAVTLAAAVSAALPTLTLFGVGTAAVLSPAIAGQAAPTSAETLAHDAVRSRIQRDHARNYQVGFLTTSVGKGGGNRRLVTGRGQYSRPLGRRQTFRYSVEVNPRNGNIRNLTVRDVR